MNSIITEINNITEFHRVEVKDFAPDGAWATQIAKHMGKETKMTQLRKVFNEIKGIEVSLKSKKAKDNDPFNEDRFLLLMPKLAFARARNLIHKDFYELMKTIIGNKNRTKIKQVKDFRRFVEFLTAIVAYHKKDVK